MAKSCIKRRYSPRRNVIVLEQVLLRSNANSDELYNALGDGTNLKDIVNSSLEIDIPNDDNKINKWHSSNVEPNERDKSTTYHGAMLHVHEGGTVYVAHAGAWRKMLLDTSGEPVANYTDFKVVAYVGNIIHSRC